MITFGLGEDKYRQVIEIFRDGEEVGKIFALKGKNDLLNSIQVCGFSDAFDFWSCGPFKGFKDIKLLFDKNNKLGGVKDYDSCIRCYREPCQCENKELANTNDIIFDQERISVLKNPFNVKRQAEIVARKL